MSASPAGLMSAIDLDVEGMTCGSCAVRIEKKLNKIPGVEATVNYATEAASVSAADGIEPEQLIKAIEAAGYHAHVSRTTPLLDPLPDPITALDDAATADAPTFGEEAERDTMYRADTRVQSGESAAERNLEATRQRLLISALLTVPIVVLSMIPALQFRNWQWLALTLASPVVVWGAWPFHSAAAKNLRHGTSTMDTLISVGTLAAFGYSVWALFWGHAGMAGTGMTGTDMTDTGMSMGFEITRNTGGEHIYLEAAAAVTTLILLGRYLEGRAKLRAGDAIRSLLEIAAKDVSIIDESGAEHRVPIEQLRVGQRFIVRPGERIATDGVVVSGHSEVDQSLVTGESVPVEMGVDSPVVGASVNGTGSLIVQATRVGDDTALAQIGRLIRQAQTGKSQVQRLADRVSAVFVPTVLLVAVGTLAWWLATSHPVTTAISAAVSVLIIACPCALGLATPTALMVGTGRAAQIGIIIRGIEVLENTRKLDTIVMDKTGTITTGQMRVVSVTSDDAGVPKNGDVTASPAMQRLAALESVSEHPIARAITEYVALEAGAATARVSDVAVSAGLGLSATVDGVEVIAGSAKFVLADDLTIPPALTAAIDTARTNGHTVVLGAWDGAVHIVVAVADQPKQTSAQAVQRLRSLGLTPIMLTGDNEAAARSVAALVGVDQVISDVLPDQKLEAIRSLQAEGRVVAMVGDGINDAAALAQSDLGISMGTGADVAIEASDLTIVSGELGLVGDAIALSRRTLGVIKANLFWAFAYNVAAIPLAAMGYLNPMIAGGAMAMSSVFVVSNSLRLRSFSPNKG